MADMEMPSIYIHLVFGASTEYEWILNFFQVNIEFKCQSFVKGIYSANITFLVFSTSNQNTQAYVRTWNE
jgi:hypothetical protein